MRFCMVPTTPSSDMPSVSTANGAPAASARDRGLDALDAALVRLLARRVARAIVAGDDAEAYSISLEGERDDDGRW